jgi:RNA-directed DNA polymerase
VDFDAFLSVRDARQANAGCYSARRALRGGGTSPQRWAAEDRRAETGRKLRRYGSKLLITPSGKNMHAFLEKVRGVIRSNRATKQEYLIRLLNPVIRGWAYYHRHIEADPAYRKVGMVLWNSLCRWAKRRHPNKSAVWIADRYWHRLGRRTWRFAVLADSERRLGLGWLIPPRSPSGATLR